MTSCRSRRPLRSRSLRSPQVAITAVVAATLIGCDPGPEPPGTGSAPDPTPTAMPAPARPPAAGDEVALRQLSDRWTRGLLAGDADSAASVYSVKAEVFLPGSSELLLGQAAVREHLGALLSRRRVLALDVQRSAFVVRPQLAYSLGVWRAVTAPVEGGAADTVAGHLTDVYGREGSGPWVVAHEHVSLHTPSPGVRDTLPTPF